MNSRGTSPAPTFPEHVGRYELLLRLGTGGMATVFLARASGVGGFERDVALKLLHAHLRDDEDSKLQLLDEAKLAARIRHPNVVPVLEADEDPVGLYLVMEYVEGEVLSALMAHERRQGGAMSRRVAARILCDALAGLHAAHELRGDGGEPLGLVHRDFSPQNIVVGIDGVARLADFGIAKATNRSVKTKTGLVKGKIAYMAPEQARGNDVDRRCDVWAAGVVAWELVSGKRLHDSEDDIAVLLSVVTQEPPLVGSVASDVTKSLEDAIAEALELEPEDRCPTALELRMRLERAFDAEQGVASHDEVGAYVQSIVADKLQERSAQIARLRERRSLGAGAHAAPVPPPRESAPPDEPRASEPWQDVETRRLPALELVTAGTSHDARARPARSGYVEPDSDVALSAEPLDVGSRSVVRAATASRIRILTWGGALLAGATIAAVALQRSASHRGLPASDQPTPTEASRGQAAQPSGAAAAPSRPDALRRARAPAVGRTTTPIAPSALPTSSTAARERPETQLGAAPTPARTTPSASPRPPRKISKSTRRVPGSRAPAQLAKSPYARE